MAVADPQTFVFRGILPFASLRLDVFLSPREAIFRERPAAVVELTSTVFDHYFFPKLPN